jgi:hypothetical protein
VQGFSKGDLENMKEWMEARQVRCEVVNLGDWLPDGKEEAWLLIARKGPGEPG